MLVQKRDGRLETVKFDKITARIEKLCYGLNMSFVEPIEIARKVIAGIYDKITTTELDELAAGTAASLTTVHPDYASLAARISISNLHKTTGKSFSSTIKRLNFHNLMVKAPEQEPANPKPLGNIETLSFNEVSFKHQTASHKAIDNISFDVKTGETIAFVGPSGSGKSTLMKLLVGLYRPQEGKILYNNLDETEIHFDDLRKQIGFVTQDTNLFSGTIRENLMFVNPSATESEVIDVLAKASCTGLLERAEKGLDTMIGEGGLKLSGGEKQRISIARALLRNPHLLIFDEATSALDSLTEEEITDTIREISSRQGQITILIAHRLSTIMHADRIYVLEKGSVVETNNHENLLADKGLYYAMWRQQIGERKKQSLSLN